MTAPSVTYLCPRCGWHGYVRKIATINDDWDAPVCEPCYNDLHPGIETAVTYWSVQDYAYNARTPEDRLPFTVVRRRGLSGRRGGRAEMYRPHLSGDREVWEFTSILVEEARDGSSYDVRPISEPEARKIMARTRAKCLA